MEKGSLKHNSILAIFIFSLVFLASCENLQNGDFSIKGKPAIERKFSLDYAFDGNYSIEAESCYLTDIFRNLPQGFSYCFDEELYDEQIFNLHLQNVSLSTLFGVVSSQMKCKVKRIGDVWYFTKGQQEPTEEEKNVKQIKGDYDKNENSINKGVLVLIRIPFLSGSEISRAFSGYGLQRVSGDLFKLSDDVSRLGEFMRLYKAVLENLPFDYAFRVELISDEILRNAFIKMNGADTGYFNFTLGKGINDFEWKIMLSAIHSAELSNDVNHNYKRIDGITTQNASFQVTVGDNIPIIKRSVSDSGTVKDVDAEYSEIGFNVSVSFDGGGARTVCKLNLSSQAVSGYVNEYPIKRGTTLNSEFSISTEKPVYVGSCYMEDLQKGLWGLKRNVTKWLVFVRVSRLDVGEWLSNE